MPGIKHRKHFHHRPLALSTLMTGIALGLPSLAASPANSPASLEASPTQLPVVNVKATRNPYKADAMQSPKFTQSLLDTPQTINVIGKEIIQQQGATTLTEALRNSPGVGTFYVGENGSTSTGDAVYMRGFDAAGSIFVDGVRDLGSISRDVFDTEQVEVIKGPDGTVYGRTTPTGAINMASKQPLLDNRMAATLAYGGWSRKRGTVDWNQAIGEHAAFRLNVMDQNSGVPGRDTVKNDRWGIAPSLAFGLGTPTTVYLDFLHITQNNIPDGGVPTIGLPGYSSPDPARPFLSDATTVDPSNFYGTAADHDDVKSDMATLIVQHELSGSAALHDTLRWGRTREHYLLRAQQSDLQGPDQPHPHQPAQLHRQLRHGQRHARSQHRL